MYCESQVKPENPSSHVRSCACITLSELYSGNVDHKMINLLVAWLIMQSRLLTTYVYAVHCYTATYIFMTTYVTRFVKPGTIPQTKLFSIKLGIKTYFIRKLSVLIGMMTWL